ncbi:MAG: FAD-dependent oxidoreductase [Rhodocyclaceae bacterium]|nr:FAD-dependent oxidoreductase [Rhodocyclaceae bacterium]MBX3669304.1 FAD-dependent oxidoreductase [Rhodocyclaceae bacterium]
MNASAYVSAPVISRYFYRRSPDQNAAQPARHPLVVVGAGPTGLCVAIDLALRGNKVVLLDADDCLSDGSRAVSYARRSLEILDRLGCGAKVVERGVAWSSGKIFFKDHHLYSFNLAQADRVGRPAFINLQQARFEEILVQRALALGVDLRWKNCLATLSQDAAAVHLQIDTPDGRYAMDCDWLIACDGANSPIRAMLGLDFKGQIFRDRFLIVDVRMQADFPVERWFWFDPPFHPGRSVLMHRQADNVWRVDFQLGWEAEPAKEKQEEPVLERLTAMLGSHEFELLWSSVYTFQCRRMEQFRHGRVLFAGDSAHQVSPHGARGANSGMQDVDNLAWKIDLVLKDQAPLDLLNSYGVEREYAAEENLRNAKRATAFITPKNKHARRFRDAVLALARRQPFARRLVNSGRLSVPVILLESPLNTPDAEPMTNGPVPGSPLLDVMLSEHGESLRLAQAVGSGFCLLLFCGRDGVPDEADVLALQAAAGEVAALGMLALTGAAAACRPGLRILHDAELAAHAAYDALPGTAYLLRPDQHVCARWRRLEPALLRAALLRATAATPN